MKKLNDNLIKEEDFSQCYRSTQLKRRKSTGRKQPIFDKYDNKHRCKYLHLIILTSFFAICNVFFSKTKERKMEATLSHSQCQVFQRLQHHVHWRVNTYSAISFEEVNFFTMAHLHFDHGKPL